jgi:type VI secretion system ImpC/EvpB family protein/type VI secretion system ImpB/VipA family protein
VKVNIDLGTPPRGSSRRSAEEPLRLLVMGNFSGASPNKGAAAPPSPHRLDLDNFDAVLKSLSPQLELTAAALGDSRVRLQFAGLDDFHPDAIFRQCGIFAALRERRALLADPATFQRTAAEMLESGKESRPLSSSEGEMFERLLGSRGRDTSAPQAAPTQASVIQGLISRVVAPHIVADLAPEQGRYIASVDAASSELMRNILHAPAFQSLESAWRGVRSLLDETEGGEEAQIWLLDVSAQQLLADIERSKDDPTTSGIFDVLVARAERAPDAESWSVVIGNYLIGNGEDDLRMLSMLGSLCRRAGAIFVAGADPVLAGCKSLAANAEPASWETSTADSEAWQALRSQPFASSIALTLPRVLARLPYGKAFDEIDSFTFEELGAEEHESLLWGNSAFALGRLLIRNFMSRGWEMEPGDELELGDLPAVVRRKGDERAMQACGEVYLSERAGERLLSLGLAPLLSHEKRAAVRFMRVQSIADPPAALSPL